MRLQPFRWMAPFVALAGLLLVGALVGREPWQKAMAIGAALGLAVYCWRRMPSGTG